MTHPLTPREKVAEIVEAAILRHHPSAVISDTLDDASDILTALASSSGDHAELADGKACGDRMIAAADALMPWLKNYPPSTRRERAIEAANAAIAASCGPLLAENAALRAQSDFYKRDNDVLMRNAWVSRATEAERKLAEAVGLLREARDEIQAHADGATPEWQRRVYDSSRSDYAQDMDIPNRIDAWLSKEAERG